MGGNEMALSPRAMSAFAEAIRTGGAGMVPEGWIETSWEPRTRSPFSGHPYGYGWFLPQFAGMPTAYARGYGGQMIYVVPEARLTVAITSDPTRPARSQGYAGDLNRLVETAIIPAARAALKAGEGLPVTLGACRTLLATLVRRSRAGACPAPSARFRAGRLRWAGDSSGGANRRARQFGAVDPCQFRLTLCGVT